MAVTAITNGSVVTKIKVDYSASDLAEINSSVTGSPGTYANKVFKALDTGDYYYVDQNDNVSSADYNLLDNDLLNINIDTRDDFTLVKSGAELDTAFPNVSGVITLTENVEIEGTISTPYQIDLNGFYLTGRNAFTDIMVYTGTSDAFTGANGGTIKLCTLVASDPSSKVFNLDDTVGDKYLILRDTNITNSNDIGLIKGFNTVAVSILNCRNNANGVTYENIEHLFVKDVFWSDTNTGTLETYTGTFEVIQNSGGQFDVSTGVTGVDISGITSLESGELISTPFLGTGTYLVGTPSVEWLINCEGLPLVGDQFAGAFLSYENGATDTPLTLNTWEYFTMASATLLADSTHRFEQLAGFPDTMVYKGLQDVVVQVVGTFGLRRIGGGTNTYQMRMVKNGGVIGGVKQFELGAVDGSITLTRKVSLSTDDQIWFEIRNITDADDIRLLTSAQTVQ